MERVELPSRLIYIHRSCSYKNKQPLKGLIPAAIHQNHAMRYLT